MNQRTESFSESCQPSRVAGERCAHVQVNQIHRTAYQIADSILDDGTNKMITQPMGTNRFFRLVLP
jgi:hypothetical protein